MIDRSRRIAAEVCDGVVTVVAPGSGLTEGCVDGGATRSESVRAGLAAVPEEAEIICVHDAARPLATTDLYRSVIAAVANGADGAIPGLGVTDTIKMVDADGTVNTTLDRSRLVAVQTPQAYRADMLRRAHAGAGEQTDDAALVEAIGGTVVVVPGEADNRKITYPDDLEFVRGVVRAADPGTLGIQDAPGVSGRTPQERAVNIRVGQGVDIHRHGGDGERSLVIAGCVFEGAPPLLGHSDADVAAHAAADALLGAAGLGDIGQLFPDDDPALVDADSLVLLGEVVDRVRAAGWTIGNIDVKVVCERPKLAPRKDEMEHNLTRVVGAPVAVSGRRAEGLGPIGRGEGIAAFAVAVLSEGSG